MERNHSRYNQIEIRKFLIKKLLKSGINISPELFTLILESDDPNINIDILIKETSFLPSFNNHITVDEILKIPNNKRPNIFTNYLNQYQKFKNIIKTKNVVVEIEKISDISEGLIKKQESDDIKAESETIREQEDNEINEKISPPEIYQDDLFSENYDVESAYETKIQNSSKIDNSQDSKVEIDKIKINQISSSIKRYCPLAKEYNANYEILKDPTGKMHTSGSYEDFMELFKDRFYSFKKLMRKRENISAANNIANILRLNQVGEVKVIGLIISIKTTSSDNKMIQIEDLTGRINLLVKNDSINYELFQKTNYLVNDIMIYVEGFYRPGENNRPGIIFVRNLTEIDIPVSFNPAYSDTPLSIALISDLHIGSKKFIPKLWKRFIKFLNGEFGNQKTRDFAGKIKYIMIAGDLIDGIGIYPNQKENLEISDIYKQYEKAAELLREIPSYIKIFYSPGSHEPVHKALPQPAVPKKYIDGLFDLGVICVGDPVLIQTEGVKTLSFHGDSLIDLNMSIPGLSHEQPTKSMKEILRFRHLAPSYGGKNLIAPMRKDWLVIDTIPDIFHTGHIHISGFGNYRNILLVNSGCFQNKTKYMESFGINPTPGRIGIVELDKRKITEINLNS
ncbi:MAG: DNA-directed DNA polymerase II small subunit [Candidatus Lokiarchaeota archaeon]|nr:DNA-directed DNA polymerase II small subunit [Candidatus Lokiarchaeota archaeon]